MKVTVENVAAVYKGLREFNPGQKIIDVSVPTLYLPDQVDLKRYVPYSHKLAGSTLFIVDVILEVGERSLVMTGLPRNRTADAPKQVIPIEGIQSRPMPVFVRYEDIPYEAYLRFQASSSGFVDESEAVKFVKKFKWPV